MSSEPRVKALHQLQFDKLSAHVFSTNETMGLAAAIDARDLLQGAIELNGEANVILATGNSQLTFLHALSEFDDIDWSRVRIFHMDEYIGIAPDHPASFPLYLRKHIIDKVKPAEFYPVSGDPDAVAETIREYDALLRRYPADLVALGFGENGHLAFNDPPYALFDDPQWVKVVSLDETSRRQQVGEGHFASLDEVPKEAITLTIPALLAAKSILAIVPEARKAEAVRACLTEPISEDHPGSILRSVDHAQLYLDQDSASKLTLYP